MNNDTNGKTKISVNMDSDAWTKFRVKCLQNGKTASEVLEGLVQQYVKK